MGVVALPLAMAFVIASGARPEQGLYTAILGGACVSLFGGSRVQIAGPTGAFVAILAGVTSTYGYIWPRTATLMAGVILVLMGATRMGAVIRFIPAPVIVGLPAGIAVTIFVGQWRDFFGLPAVYGEHFHERVWRLIQVLPQLNLPTTALASASLLVGHLHSTYTGPCAHTRAAGCDVGSHHRAGDLPSAGRSYIGHAVRRHPTRPARLQPAGPVTHAHSNSGRTRLYHRAPRGDRPYGHQHPHRRHAVRSPA